jgi:hypothetical protein
MRLAQCSTLGSTRVGSQVAPLKAIASKSGSHMLFHSSTKEHVSFRFGIVVLTQSLNSDDATES